MLSELALTNNSLIIAITESHLNQDISDAEIQIEGFNSFRSDRIGNTKGGVIVYINAKWESQPQVLAAGSVNLIEYL